MVFSFLDIRKTRQPGPPIQFRGLGEVRAYWEGLRKDSALPTRADLDPRGMAAVLDQVFVAERIGTGLARMRIAGTALADISGIDMKGLPLSVLTVPESRLRLAEVVERVFTAPQIAELDLEAETGIGRPTLHARLLLLPLRSTNGTRDLILGCLATHGDPGRAPRRFTITRTKQERLDLPGAPARQPAAVMAFAEPPAPPISRPLTGPARLRLVYSAD